MSAAPPVTPAAPDRLTISHYSTRELKIILLERFPATKSALENITSLTNISILTSNFTSLLSRSPLSRTPVINFFPSIGTPGPDNAKLAEIAQSFNSQDASIIIGPFSRVTTDIKTSSSADENLRITFSCDGCKFRVEVNPKSKTVTRQVTPLTVGTRILYYAVWHQAYSHLTLFTTPQLAKWMELMPGSLPISALSMPGTHNTPTHFVAAPSVRCQAVDIPTQLKNGIRFFDIRAQPDGNNMWLAHGSFPISLTGKEYLGKLLQDTYDFLDRNPTECVVVSLKREGPLKSTDEIFSKNLYDNFVQKTPSKWYTAPTIPRLSAARGKCVLLRRFNLDPSLQTLNDGKGWGIDASSWAYNTANNTTSSGDIIVQDFCEVLAADNVETKVNYVKEHIKRASALTYSHAGKDSKEDRAPFYLNFLSAANFWNVRCWPEGIAEMVSPAIIEYLAREHEFGVGDGGTGVLVADYVGGEAGGGWDLVRLVVAINGVVAGKVKMREDMEEAERAEQEEVERLKKAVVEKVMGDVGGH